MPGTDIAMGYDDTKVIEALGFLQAVSGLPNDDPTIHDAVARARALDAIVESARIGGWVKRGG